MATPVAPLLLVALILAPRPLAAADRVLRAQLTLAAPVAEVFQAWSTTAGVRSFFSADARVEPHVDGLYEILFDISAPEGLRGSEGMRILQLDPPRRLAFTWNAPTRWPKLRAQRTMVIIDLEPLGEKSTRMMFTHLGWGNGEEWDQLFDDFDRGWGQAVLPRLIARFSSGPIDWTRPSPPSPLASMKLELTPASAD